MLWWKQLNYIPILLLPLHSNTHYVIKGLSRDRFDESRACVSTCLKDPGFLQLCSASFFFSCCFPPRLNLRQIMCPIWRQEAYGNNSVRWSHPPKASLLWLKDTILSWLRGSPSSEALLSICSATLWVWLAFYVLVFFINSVKLSHMSKLTRCWRFIIFIQFFYRCSLKLLTCSSDLGVS